MTRVQFPDWPGSGRGLKRGFRRDEKRPVPGVSSGRGRISHGLSSPWGTERCYDSPGMFAKSWQSMSWLFQSIAMGFWWKSYCRFQLVAGQGVEARELTQR